MKTKSNIVMAFVILMVFVSLCGCAKSGDVDYIGQTGTAINNTEEAKTTEIAKVTETDYSEPTNFEIEVEEETEATEIAEIDDNEIDNLEGEWEGEVSAHAAPLEFWNSKDANFKSNLTQQISISKTAKEQDQDYSLYGANRISDISEFYFPAMKLDGYEMYCSSITEYNFIFYYSPSEELQKNNDLRSYHQSNMYDKRIQVMIFRPKIEVTDIYKIATEQAERDGTGYLTEDNLLYEKRLNTITAQLGNTWVNIRVPDKLNNYEYLRDLILQLVKTAELVKIK